MWLARAERLILRAEGRVLSRSRTLGNTAYKPLHQLARCKLAQRSGSRGGRCRVGCISRPQVGMLPPGIRAGSHSHTEPQRQQLEQAALYLLLGASQAHAACVEWHPTPAGASSLPAVTGWQDWTMGRSQAGPGQSPRLARLSLLPATAQLLRNVTASAVLQHNFSEARL